MDEVHLPRSDEDYERMREAAAQLERPRKGAKSITFTVGQKQEELFSVEDGDWELVGLEIDGANFGDGLNSFAEVFIDRSGLFNVAAPLGIRVAAGYFGGYTPFHFEGHQGGRRVSTGESVYLSVENGTTADVIATVEWEIRRVKHK